MLLVPFLYGCASLPPLEKTKTVKESKVSKPNPSWILNPPKDTKDFIYGVGEANNRKAAIKSALADLISKISLTVNSQTN